MMCRVKFYFINLNDLKPLEVIRLESLVFPDPRLDQFPVSLCVTRNSLAGPN